MIATFKDPGVFVNNLKAALLAVCEDIARTSIASLRIEIRPGVARFVATNGHWLWINEVPCDCEAPGSVQIRPEDVKRIVKLVNVTKKASTWAVELDVPEVCTCKISQMGQSITIKPWIECFAPYAQVLPSPSALGGERIVASFDATIMADVSAAFVLVGTAWKKGAQILMHTGPDRKSRDGKMWPEPIVFTSAVASRALAVLMPMRGDVLPADGLLSDYRGESSKTEAA